MDKVSIVLHGPGISPLHGRQWQKAASIKPLSNKEGITDSRAISAVVHSAHRYEIDVIRGRLYSHRNPYRGVCSMTGTRCGESFHLSRQKRQQSLLGGSGAAFILTSSHCNKTNMFFKELPRYGCFQIWQRLLSKALIPNMTSHLNDLDSNTTTGGRFRVRTAKMIHS